MKKLWKKISVRIDSRTLRERAMLFGMTAGILIFVVFFFFLNPGYLRQKQLLETMSGERDKIAVIETEIIHTIEAHTIDPDLAERARLRAITQQVDAVKEKLTSMQQGMVPADKMTGLLEQMLRAHRGLKLASMRTLSGAESAAVPAPVAAPAPGAAPVPAAPVELLHRHGVELVVQGSYADMVAYLNALEHMQGQLFWGDAKLAMDSWPSGTLTLTVYTVNLDKKWLKL
jgi:MSHA biogenesis protein MshJ